MYVVITDRFLGYITMLFHWEAYRLIAWHETGKWRINNKYIKWKKNLEGSSRGLLQGNIHAFTKDTEENHKHLSQESR
jgi:hypothetical protein